LSFKIKNKSRIATASENVAKRPCKSIRSEEKVEIIRRIQVGELSPAVSSDLNMAPSTVTTMPGISSHQ
jgi:hypothetical protein